MRRRAAELEAAGVAFVEATVVRCARPSSARPGDRAIVLGDGTLEGFVGGSCADASVRLQALRALETGDPVLLRILPGAADGPSDEDGAVVVANPCLSGGALELFLEPHLPAPRVAVAGESPVARALAELGA
ncbi:MAG TPA: XdhC family protein, partial [Solirubrobacteraceae bacterium]|nr:XdhC family protein [Solirubrobacteraceae bacterium]